MLRLNSSLMIITDLDGSLLDHHDYNWDAATEWLARLKQHAIPLVICSSKTAAEIVPLQKRLGISGSPFIAENGARIALEGELSVADEPGEDYLALCHSLKALQSHFRFSGFHDFSDAEVARFTGLTLAEASQSRRRDASEVVLWRDDADKLDAFREALAEQHLALTQGGRFWHVMPAGCGKGVALQQVQQHLAQREGSKRITIGLGDGPNDAPMLEHVDYAVVIKGFSKSPVVLTRSDQQNIYHTAHVGPLGWREGLDYFLAQPD
ncbi:mannosyl-3-phosphoglycerate phosphatase-related protein [Pantoea rodasii]|uniref:Mannosyl-3-phosphoglycerate phosphatase-related protein n=1 Tax=Pantoea rodasii TaxID=1076549 RepID=A0A2M9WFI0_9GAMM|nr:mannosyl-3-phosphoglycerate phosphatase-related protein [Pantoea rodasii]ORM57491.1 mannosyl-3-phosphoglycerate phosphatase [Pantoea rodasii]PJZ06310.1 mannosyl-3-phosphoglycerate phosphatase-related protein [Pantoea rodasii]